MFANAEGRAIPRARPSTNLNDCREGPRPARPTISARRKFLDNENPTLEAHPDEPESVRKDQADEIEIEIEIESKRGSLRSPGAPLMSCSAEIRIRDLGPRILISAEHHKRCLRGRTWSPHNFMLSRDQDL